MHRLRVLSSPSDSTGEESFDSIVCLDGNLGADPRGNATDNGGGAQPGGGREKGAGGGERGGGLGGMSTPNF